jgi:hypothetical protein
MAEMFRFDLRVFAREKEVVGARRLVYSFFFFGVLSHGLEDLVGCLGYFQRDRR